MNFQENSNDVSQRVFTGCGRPVLGRRRRRDNRELELESLNFDQETSTDDRASTGATLDKLVKETRQRVRDSKQFWVYLPYKLCNDGLVVPPSNTKECWNGTHVDKWVSLSPLRLIILGEYSVEASLSRKIKFRITDVIITRFVICFRYIYPVSSNGETQTLNPEVRSSGPRPTIVRDQIFALTTITNRLKSAYNGQDVDWIDTGNEFQTSNFSDWNIPKLTFPSNPIRINRGGIMRNWRKIISTVTEKAHRWFYSRKLQRKKLIEFEQISWLNKGDFIEWNTLWFRRIS